MTLAQILALPSSADPRLILASDNGLLYHIQANAAGSTALALGDAAVIQTQLDAKVDDFALLRYADTLPSNVILSDTFADPNRTTVAAGSTAVANPGPGVMRSVNVVGQVQRGRGNLVPYRYPIRGANTSSSRTSVRWDRDASTAGVVAANGLTMIARFIPALPIGRYVPDRLGFSLSATEIDANSAGSVYYQMGESLNSGVDLYLFPRTVGMTGGDFSGAAEHGELISVAIKYETLGTGTTRISYWLQGGSLAESFGCKNYTDNWMCMFVEQGGTDLAAGTIVYPFVSKYAGVGTLDLREVTVLSDWNPSPRHGLLDHAGYGKLGMHAPNIVRDPVTGLLVAVWQNGTSDENIDLKLNASVRLANGTWTERVTVVPALGGNRALLFGSTMIVNGQIWVLYTREPVTEVHGGGEIMRRTLVPDSNGVITVGAEVPLSIAGTTNHVAGMSIQLPASHPYPNRILLFHNEPTNNIKCARSDDGGSTWTVVSVSGAQTLCMEASGVIESDGAIGCYYRSNLLTGLTPTRTHYSRSTDGGVTWSAPTVITSILSRQRVVAKNMEDGSIWLINGQDSAQRRKLRMWRMGDNGVVLGSIPYGDSSSSAGGATIWRYPSFLQDGKDIVTINTHMGANAWSTTTEYHTTPWLGEMDPAFEWIGQNGQPRSSLQHFKDGSYFTGPIGNAEWFQFVAAASTVTLDCNKANDFVLEVQGDFTLAAPTNPLQGQEITVCIMQSSSTAYNITLNAAIKQGPYTVALSSTLGSASWLKLKWSHYNAQWHVRDFKTGY